MQKGGRQPLAVLVIGRLSHWGSRGSDGGFGSRGGLPAVAMRTDACAQKSMPKGAGRQSCGNRQTLQASKSS